MRRGRTGVEKIQIDMPRAGVVVGGGVFFLKTLLAPRLAIVARERRMEKQYFAVSSRVLLLAPLLLFYPFFFFSFRFVITQFDITGRNSRHVERRNYMEESMPMIFRKPWESNIVKMERLCRAYRSIGNLAWDFKDSLKFYLMTSDLASS